ncbi:MAG: UDP-N-acetylglucosamine--N-acetylmuramyl-(pentapeptide) pyrophosphoryl-undecaprenol N-acetylglucosamine transferase [Burkholderia sp.]
MSTSEKHLVIAAAGTGGHVMPGLAVARAMAARGWKISWVGTSTGMEGELVGKQGIPFHALDFQGVRGHGVAGALKGGVKLVGAYFESRRLLEELKPDAVFSTGGYVAVPLGVAAGRMKLPLVLMNCDADLLLSTKTLMPFCDALACGFAGGARAFAREKGRTTGNPVRREILAVAPPQDRMQNRKGPIRLFVFGGSLGAKVFNETMPQVIAAIPAAQRPIVVHQTGKGRDEPVRAAYEKLGVKAEVVPFIDDMAARYEACDAVICRAGATSISELCAAGVASILVPFVAKTTAHQMGNARYMADRNAAILVPQEEFTVERMSELISGLTRDRLLEIAKNARASARPQAAESVADLIEEIWEKKTAPAKAS